MVTVGLDVSAKKLSRRLTGDAAPQVGERMYIASAPGLNVGVDGSGAVRDSLCRQQTLSENLRATVAHGRYAA